jgi:hypothetical protein
MAALAAADALVSAESKLTELDSVAGDGDLGSSMKQPERMMTRISEGTNQNSTDLLKAPS